MADQNDRPPLVVALEWVNKITTFAVIMALPALGGWWLDGRFGTEPWCLLVGGAIGFVASFSYLLKVTGQPGPRDE